MDKIDFLWYNIIMKISYAKGYKSSDFFSERDFFVNNVGFYKKLESNLKIYREKGRKDYHLIVVKNGTLFVNGKLLSNGEGYLFYPNETQNYKYVARENCEYYWLHFSGAKVGVFLAEVGLLSGLVSLGGKAHKVFELFENIIAAYNMEMKFADDYANGLLISLISLIASPLILPPPFYKAVKLLSDVHANFTMKEIASNIGMAESYFIRTFKKVLGVTPLAFRNKKRIIIAKNLLRETDFSINEIARLCGMDDALYFSRFFKRFEGVSPLLYRQKIKNLFDIKKSTRKTLDNKKFLE